MKITYLTCAAVVVSAIAATAAEHVSVGQLSLDGKTASDEVRLVSEPEFDTDMFIQVARTTGSQRRPRARIKTAKPRRKLRAPSRVIVTNVPYSIRSKWKRSTWQAYRTALGLTGTQGTQAIPDTDCPPAPTQECIDSWKDPNDDIANWPD